MPLNDERMLAAEKGKPFPGPEMPGIRAGEKLRWRPLFPDDSVAWCGTEMAALSGAAQEDHDPPALTERQAEKAALLR
jgi:hypothetical protein